MDGREWFSTGIKDRRAGDKSARLRFKETVQGKQVGSWFISAVYVLVIVISVDESGSL